MTEYFKNSNSTFFSRIRRNIISIMFFVQIPKNCKGLQYLTISFEDFLRVFQCTVLASIKPKPFFFPTKHTSRSLKSTKFELECHTDRREGIKLPESTWSCLKSSKPAATNIARGQPLTARVLCTQDNSSRPESSLANWVYVLCSN